jgi:hypothetical protein
MPSGFRSAGPPWARRRCRQLSACWHPTPASTQSCQLSRAWRWVFLPLHELLVRVTPPVDHRAGRLTSCVPSERVGAQRQSSQREIGDAGSRYLMLLEPGAGVEPATY